MMANTVIPPQQFVAKVTDSINAAMVGMSADEAQQFLEGLQIWWCGFPPKED